MCELIEKKMYDRRLQLLQHDAACTYNKYYKTHYNTHYSIISDAIKNIIF